MHGKSIICRYIYNTTRYLEEQTGVLEAEYGVTYPDVVEKIFLADVVAVLLSEDYSCTLEQGYKLAWLSELYGAKEFPFRDNCPVLHALQAEDANAKRLFNQDDDGVDSQGALGKRTKHADK